jgi:hypothetical protein
MPGGHAQEGEQSALVRLSGWADGERAAVDAFGGAINRILNTTHAGHPPAGAATTMMSAALCMLQSIAHYRTATEAINDPIASRVAAGLR